MSKLDSFFKRFVLKNKLWLFILIFSAFALVCRLSLFRYTNTSDYVLYLHTWFVEIKSHGGFKALSHQVGDYNIPYQFLISIMSYIPIRDVYLYKSLSVLFDYALAFIVGKLIVQLDEQKSRKFNKMIFCLAFAVILMTPTVFMNSSLWGQCDSIYTFFVVLSLGLLFNNKIALSMFFYGIAIAFKLQSVFILPFYLLMYFIKRNISVMHYFIPLISFWLCGIPGFIVGRSLMSPFTIYAQQASEYPSMFFNYYNFAGMLGFKVMDSSSYNDFAKSFIMLTVMILLVGFFVCLSLKVRDNKDLLILSAWVVLTCVVFLPGMHERYAYLADILLICSAFVNPRYVIVAVLNELSSLMSYSRYLFGVNMNPVPYSFISVLIYCLLTYLLFSDILKKSGFLKIS